MAVNRNSNVAEEIRDVLKLQQNVDGNISNVAGQIIPVVDVNPKHARIVNVCQRLTKTTTGDGTVYTTPSDKDFYMTNLQLSFIKDAACDAATGNLSVTAFLPDGSNPFLLSMPIITLTAQQSQGFFNFSAPVLLKKGSAIVSTGSFTAGALSRTVNVIGYTVDNPKA